MNDEIKEIIDMFTKYKDDWYSCEYKLKPKQCVAVLDYITNLQQENERLNNIINELEDKIVIKLQRDYHEPDYRINTGDLEELYDKLKELKEGK